MDTKLNYNSENPGYNCIKPYDEDGICVETFSDKPNFDSPEECERKCGKISPVSFDKMRYVNDFGVFVIGVPCFILIVVLLAKLFQHDNKMIRF